MDNKHQQMIPSDMETHPRPGEREIRVKAASQTHHERPTILGGLEHE